MYQATIVQRVKKAVIQGLIRARQSRTPDREVVKAAEKRLQDSPYAALRTITCEFREGTLVLRGRVTSYYLKQLAQETVRSLEGIGGILNVVEARRATNGSSPRTVAGKNPHFSEEENHVSTEPKTW